MHDVRKVDVMEGILDENDAIAANTSEHMAAHGVLVVNEMGAPGVGKTTSLKHIFQHLPEDIKPYVIEGDIESDLDTQDLTGRGIDAHQINTFGACHLDAPMVHEKLNSISFDQRGILFIENIGNLVCPAEFMIGEHLKMLIVTVTEGSDKPYKYPLAFEKADLILLNKVDLIPYLDFDEDFFMKGVRALNKEVPVFRVSGKTGEGYREVTDWLVEKARQLEPHEHRHDAEHDHHHAAEHDHHHHDAGHDHQGETTAR
ncbi:MAG: hydrogenase nickel incorporation protein HypB [Anaerovoracaceae bacterium]|jgi:hydrogenase nickel incorporation protein HypB